MRILCKEQDNEHEHEARMRLLALLCKIVSASVVPLDSEPMAETGQHNLMTGPSRCEADHFP